MNLSLTHEIDPYDLSGYLKSISLFHSVKSITGLTLKITVTRHFSGIVHTLSIIRLRLAGPRDSGECAQKNRAT